MREVQSLRTHLITELRDLLDAEQQLTTVLRDFAERAATPALRSAFEQHLGETERHVDRLRQAFEALGESAQPKRCEGIHGLIREGNAVISATPAGAFRDAVMITSAQKVEHYEMASYGTARTYAQVLGEPNVARLLEDTLKDEKAADAKLTEIAEGKVNEKAAEEWHDAAAGLLEQTAALAGQAVGIGARTAKRAADAIGLGHDQRRADANSAVQQVATSLNRAVEAASDTLSEVGNSAASQARRITQPIAQAARRASGGGSTSRARQSKRKATRKGSRQQAKTRNRKSRGR